MWNVDVSISSGWQSCCWGLCWKVLRLPGNEDIERTWRRNNGVIQHFLVISTLVCHIMSEALLGRDQCFLLCLPRADTTELHCWLGFQGSTRIKMLSDVILILESSCSLQRTFRHRITIFPESLICKRLFACWKAGWGKDTLCAWHF